MGNLVWSVVPDHTNSGPRAILKIKAVNEEIQSKIKSLIEEAVEEGVIRAKREAPKGKGHHFGARIEDSIYAEPIRYHPGGAGGGGFFEGSFRASNEIAPHLEWVYLGTGLRNILHPHRIYPLPPRRVMMSEYWGGREYFTSSQGQFPQQRWWADAEERAERKLSTSIRHLDLEIPD